MKRIRLKDFLTIEEKDDLVFNNSSIGLLSFIDAIFPQGAIRSWELENLYFLEHSPNKYIREYAIETVDQWSEGDRPSGWQHLGKMLKAKFGDKWARIVYTLNIEYEPDFSYHHLKEKTHGLTISDGGTDTTAYNSNTTITENDSSTINDSVYAFNSVSDVPSAKSSDVGNTQSTNLRGGQDTFTSQNTKQHSGTDSTLMEGHDRVVSKLLTDEIEFRNKFILYDIIFKDIDSILTLQIY